MVIRSLGRRTDLIFARFSGTVIDRGSYTLVQTPSNPEFHWGNYIVFDHSPRMGSLSEWTAIFDRDFGYYPESHHYVFTWDTDADDKGETQEFFEAGFELDSAVVLTTSRLNEPPHLNSRVEVRRISSERDWSDVRALQVLCADPKFFNDAYEEFVRRKVKDYKNMVEAGLGAWFGAFLGGKLIGDLGIFHENGVGRYQNVGTHPDHRRQGICGTLVYRAGQLALNEFKVDRLVMEADVDYHAARIYESVGFKRNEVNHALSWWKGKDGSGN